MDEQDRRVIMSSNKMDWETPQPLFDGMDKIFHFTLDPAASHENAKCQKYYTKDDDGLQKSWQHETIFLNPPYGRDAPLWIEKAYSESLKDSCDKVVLIAARTDTRVWANYCSKAAEIYFIKGRLRFSGSKDAAPFPSAIVVFNSQREGGRKIQWTNTTFTKFW
jgi:phage N-6-adenine-methyltransferase